jgi:hypothetical protein
MTTWKAYAVRTRIGTPGRHAFESHAFEKRAGDPDLLHGAMAAGVDSVPADRSRLWQRTKTTPTPRPQRARLRPM